MAKIEFIDNGAYLRKLEVIATHSYAIAESALRRGASLLADAVREKIKATHVTKDKLLMPGQRLTGFQREREAKQVAGSFGITETRSTEAGMDVKVGYAGYSDFSTERYPRGIPILMIAASTEVGSQVRKAKPFWRKLVTRMKPTVIDRMQQSIDDDLATLLPENKGE